MDKPNIDITGMTWEQVLELRADRQFEVDDIQAQIDDAQLAYWQDKEPIDREWLRLAKKAIRIKRREVQWLQVQAGKLRNLNFKGVAKEMLPLDTYIAIEKATKGRLSAQKDDA